MPTITKPSRITHTSATLIDNIFISENLTKRFVSNIIVDDISDHLICLLQISNNSRNSDSKEPLIFETREVKPEHIDRIKLNLEKTDWSNIGNLDLNSAMEKLHNSVTTELDNICPLKVVKISGKKRIKEPWMTKGLVKSGIELSKCFKKMILGKVNERNYKFKRSLYNKLKRYARKDFFVKKFLEFKGQSRKVWNLVNSVTGKLSNRNSLIDMIKVSHREIIEPLDIAEEFAKFFSNVGRKTVDKIQEIKHKPIQMTLNSSSIYLKPVTIEEMNDYLKLLPNKRSCGFDDISNEFLKDIGSSIIRPLTQIVNKTIEESTFPDILKMAVVSPLHKGKERYFTTNYRPISLLPVLSKLFERVLHTQFSEFLEKTNVFFSGQFGFRKDHSTVLAVNHMVNRILAEHENGKLIGAVYIDLSKAFDTICHKMLLEKLNRMGIRGTANQLVRSYLEGRKIKIKIKSQSGKFYSNDQKVDMGCPQGSILGPLFFSCVINDLHLQLVKCECICYADDTTILSIGKSVTEIEQKLNHDLSILTKWFSLTKLSLNISKTQFQIFSLGHKTVRNASINIDGIPIQDSKSVKMLGFIIDSKLNWNEHVESVLRKLRSTKFMLNSIKNLLPTEIRKIFYYAHYYSHIQYGLSVWGPMISKRLEKLLFTDQKKGRSYHNKFTLQCTH